MKKFLSLLLVIALVLGLSVTAFAEETVTITVHMTDYGCDGWEHEASRCYVVALSEPYTGAYFDPDESIVLAECTFDTDAEETATFTVGKYQLVYFYWVEGPYPYEAGFTIYRDGVAVYSHVAEAEEGGWDCELEDGELLFTSGHVEGKSTTISYDVAPTYTVTIPATVELGETATIQVSDVLLVKGKQVEVSLAEASDFVLTTPQGAELPYTVKNGNTEINEGDTILTVDPAVAQVGAVTLSFAAAETAKYAGEYTGTVIFSVAVVDQSPISFTIDGITYQADAGMTWDEWVESAYDSEDKWEWDGGVRNTDWFENGWYIVNNPGATNAAWDKVQMDDVIQADAAYVSLLNGPM